MARKRIKVGTLIGTEGRNDDESILRTPLMQFGTASGPTSMPTETTNPAPRSDAPSAPNVGDSWEGDGSGSNGPSGGGGKLGGKDMTLADFTEQAIAAVSSMSGSGGVPSGLSKGLGLVSSVLNNTSSEEFGRFGEKPGLGMQTKSQAQGTLAQARSRVGPDEEEEDQSKYSGYAPPAPPSKTEEPAYNPAENADLGRGLGPAGQDDKSQLGAGSGTGLSPTDGSFASFGGQEHGNSKAPGVDERGLPGTEYTGSSGTGNRDKQGATGQDKGDTGDSGQGNGGGSSGGGQGGGTGGATGGEGASGDSSGGGQGGTGTGGGAFEDGVIDIEGPDPMKKGEAIPGVTLHEGETVLTDAETTLIGEKALRKIRKIAADKNTSLAKRRQDSVSTLLSAAR